MINKEVNGVIDSLSHKKRIINVIDNIPLVYRIALYLLLNDIIGELVFEGSRESGKTMFLTYLTKLYAELFPEADIVITRDNQKEHLRGLIPRLKRLFKEEEIFLSLKDFKLHEMEMEYVRSHKNGHIQKIMFIGEKQGGLQKNKSVSPYGYFSLVIKDEAEENAFSEDIDPLMKKQATEDKKRTFRRRDFEQYKDYDKYPSTKFVYAFNPKSPNGEFKDLYEKYLEPNIKELEDKGYQMVIIPNYKNGTGLALFRTNIFCLLNDEKKFWPSKEAIQEVKWFKENEPEIYKLDYLGIRAIDADVFFEKYKRILRHKLDVQSIPISIGIDQGLSDNTVAILNVNEFIWVNDSIQLTDINGSVEEININGKKLMTSKDKKNHIIFTSKEIYEYLIKNVFIDDNWMQYYKSNPFVITFGPKDSWLMSELIELFEKFRPHLMDYIWFVDLESEAKYAYDINSRINLEYETIKKRQTFLSNEATPELYKAYMRYGLNNYKNNKDQSLNFMDAYFYSRWYYFNYIKKSNLYYDYFEKEN